MRHVSPSDCVPEPCRVLGTALAPFALGHHLLFVRLGLPFAAAPFAEATDAQIMLGIAICAARPTDTLEAMLDGSWPGIVRRWQRRLLWRQILRPFARDSFADDRLLFQSYLADGYQQPPTWETKSSGPVLRFTSPWEFTLKNRLVLSGYSERDVLDGYLPARWHDFHAIGEMKSAEGLKDHRNWHGVFVTKSDVEAFEAAKAHRSREATP